MKKWNVMLLVLALLMLPAAGLAEDLPDFLSAVAQLQQRFVDEAVGMPGIVLRHLGRETNQGIEDPGLGKGLAIILTNPRLRAVG